MKEIKFRAWDKEGKKMYYPGDWPEEESTKHLMWVDMEGIGMLFDGQFIVCDECGSFAYLSPDRYLSMQYTGLMDKNGKEIWGGDVLRFVTGYIGAVIYEPPFWECGGMIFGAISYNKAGIIGNIYEHPKLLSK